MTKPPAHPVQYRFRVYFEDTDAAGVVYHANYLKLMERARSEWFLEHSLGLTGLMERHGCVFVVHHIELDFLHSARLEDLLDITVSLVELNKASAVFHQQVLQTEHKNQRSQSTPQPPKLVCRGKVSVACVRTNNFRPTAIPQEVLKALQTLAVSS